MKKQLEIVMLILGSLLLASSEPVISQRMPLASISHSGKARIFTEGMRIEGKNLRVVGDKVMIDTGMPMTFNIDEVDMIEIRKSRVGTGALACGGSCALLVLLSVASYEQEYEEDPTKGEMVAGGILWVGISSAIGAGVGYLVSGWETMYFRPKTALGHPSVQDRRVALYLVPNPQIRSCNVGLRYRF